MSLKQAHTWQLNSSSTALDRSQRSTAVYSVPFGRDEKQWLLYQVKKPVLLKCVKLYPIIMPADKGNTNTLCIKGP